MLFTRRESFRQYLRYYPVTASILGINILLFILTLIFGSPTDPATLIRFGALFKIGGVSAEWWRYVSAIFLHIGFYHLLFNSFAIYVFAPPLERMIGKWHYIAFYLLSGVAGNIVSQYFTPGPNFSAGASGAIYGIYAAYLYLGLFRKHILDEQSKQTVTTILIVGLIYSVVVPHVNLYAHLGGFAGGWIYLNALVKTYNRH